MQANEEGNIIVTAVRPGSQGEGHLEAGDTLQKIGGTAVGAMTGPEALKVCVIILAFFLKASAHMRNGLSLPCVSYSAKSPHQAHIACV